MDYKSVSKMKHSCFIFETNRRKMMGIGVKYAICFNNETNRAKKYLFSFKNWRCLFDEFRRTFEFKALWQLAQLLRR